MRSIWTCECGEENNYSGLMCRKCGKPISNNNKKRIFAAVIDRIKDEIGIEQQEKLEKRVAREEKVIAIAKRAMLMVTAVLLVSGGVTVLLNKQNTGIGKNLISELEKEWTERHEHYSKMIDLLGDSENVCGKISELEAGMERTTLRVNLKIEGLFWATRSTYEKTLRMAEFFEVKLLSIRNYLQEVINELVY